MKKIISLSLIIVSVVSACVDKSEPIEKVASKKGDWTAEDKELFILKCVQNSSKDFNRAISTNQEQKEMLLEMNFNINDEVETVCNCLVNVAEKEHENSANALASLDIENDQDPPGWSIDCISMLYKKIEELMQEMSEKQSQEEMEATMEAYSSDAY
jgi:hypothetical protein